MPGTSEESCVRSLESCGVFKDVVGGVFRVEQGRLQVSMIEQDFVGPAAFGSKELGKTPPAAWSLTV